MEEMEGVEAYENPQKSETNEEEDENKFAFQVIDFNVVSNILVDQFGW